MTPPHVRRRSKFADRLLEFPQFVFSDGREFSRRGAWREPLPPSSGLIVEIGCNDASLLVRIAAKHPDAVFIGIDWKCRAIHTAAVRVAEAGLRNVALLNARAQDFARLFAPGEVDEIWLFHPDPCDGPRERPNRLFSQPFLTDAADIVRKALILKTDHREYFESAIELGNASSGFAVSASSVDFWSDPAVLAHTAPRFFAGESSSFENRFRKKRKAIYYLELSRK